MTTPARPPHDAERLGPYTLGPYDTDSMGVITGDARVLAEAIPDASVDLIFTDPPYASEFIPLYGELAAIAARILKPDGFLLIYAGVMSKPKVMWTIGQHLEYFFDYISFNTGNASMCWSRKTVSRYKSILAYSKNSGLPRTNVLGVWKGGGQDKRYHIWQQDESAARYYIDCFSKPSDIVLDFCTGSGTFPAVCKVLERRWLAFEIDPATADIARARIANTQPPLPGLVCEQLALPEAADLSPDGGGGGE